MSDTGVAIAPLDVARIRADFPILQRQVNGHPLVYLDSAATSQKPQVVLDATDAYYQQHNANVHRGVHTLGNEATDVFESARQRVARFIDAPSEGVVFVRNTTEALNLVASSYARELLSARRPRGAHRDGAPQQPGARGSWPPNAPASPWRSWACATTAPSTSPTSTSCSPRPPSW